MNCIECCIIIIIIIIIARERKVYSVHSQIDARVIFDRQSQRLNGLHAPILQRTLTHSGVEIEVSLEAIEPV